MAGVNSLWPACVDFFTALPKFRRAISISVSVDRHTRILAYYLRRDNKRVAVVVD